MSDWDHFTKAELECHCGCGEMKMKDTFMQKLVGLRKIWGKPMRISSAYRCQNHPVEKKKAKAGTHNEGRAVDIVCNGEEALKLLSLICQVGIFTGVGISQRGNRNTRFIHIDDTISDARPNIWSY